MIVESKKERDYVFVSRALRQYHLSPWPKHCSVPETWQHSKRSVTLERYDWGVVLFVSDCTRPQWHATLVCVGDVDLSSGVVTDGDGSEDLIPVHWLGRVIARSMRERAVGTEHDTSLPTCLGYHEHCCTCDGGINAVGTLEAVCAWRSRCYALKLYLDETSTTLDVFVDSFTDPVELHTRLAEIEHERLLAIPAPAVPEGYSRDDGKAKGTDTPHKKFRGKSVGIHWTAKIPDPGRFDDVEPLIRAFLRRLRRGLVRLGYGWAKRRSLAYPGCAYVNRVTKRSNYLTVYIAAPGRYVKVVMLWLKPLLKSMNVAFKVPFDDALGVPGTVLKHSVDYPPLTEWRKVKDVQTARLAARTILRMIRRGLLKLPDKPSVAPHADS